MGQRLRQIEQLSNGIHPNHPSSAKGGIKSSVIACQSVAV